MFNGKTLVTAVVIQTTADATLDVAHPQGGGRLQGAAPVVLCQALGCVGGARWGGAARAAACACVRSDRRPDPPCPAARCRAALTPPAS